MILGNWNIKASDYQCIEKVQPDSISIHSSAGGQLFAAHEIAKLVRDRNIKIHAAKDCLSACTIILAAANESTMCTRANIGVHHFGANGKAVRDDKVLGMHVSAMAGFGIDPGRYKAIMLNTPYPRFHYMNNQEMRNIGFKTKISPRCT